MTGLPSQALSIMQPWAWLIVNGHKDIENRTWRRSYTGPVLIHAGLKIDGEAHQDLLSGHHPVTGQQMSDDIRLAYTHAFIDTPCRTTAANRGGIVGVATITGCVGMSPSPWFVGPYGFTLTDARPLPFMPLAGKLSFFPVEYVAPAE